MGLDNVITEKFAFTSSGATGVVSNYKQVTAESSKLTSAVGKQATSTAVATASAGKLGGALAGLKAQASAVNARVLAMNKSLANLRWAMVNVMFVGAALAGIAAPFVIMAKNFTEFEKGVYKISAATGEAAESIKGKLMDAASGSVFALDDISASFLEINKAGFEAADAMTVVKNAQSLALAGFSDLDDAANLLITTLHAYNMSGAEAGYVTEVIAKVANATASDVETLGTALSYVVGNASQLGITLPEVIGMLGVLQNAGLTSSKAGTSLNQALQSLIKPGAQASDIMERLGVAWQDSSGKARNTVAVLDDLRTATNGLSNSAEVLANIFGARGARAVNMLFNQANAAGESISDMAMQLQMAGGVSDNVATQMESNANRMAQAGNSLRNVFATSKTAEFFSNLGTHAIRGADLVVRAIDMIVEKQKSMEGIKEQIKYFKYGNLGAIAYGVKNLAGAGKEINTEREDEASYQTLSALGKLYADIAKAKEEGRKEDAKALESQADLLKVREELHTLTMEAFEEQAKSTGVAKENAKEEYDNYGRVGSRIEEIMQLQKLYNITVAEAVDMLLGMEDVGKYFEISTAEANKLAKAIEKVGDYWADFWKSIRQSGENSQIRKISSWIDDIDVGRDMETDAMREGGAGEGAISEASRSYQEMINVLSDYRENMRDVQAEVDDLNDDLRAMDALIKQTTVSLKAEKRELKSWQNQLDDINDTISDLTSARFKDQTATEALMSAGERWLKKEELAERGITDAHGYIQEMLGKSEHGYYKLFDSITAVNNAANDGMLTYKAWRETVSAFIEETVASGNKLGSNVSGSVTQYQTMLMGTTEYQEDSGAESDRINEVEQVIRNLKDSYAVYYGEMQDDVAYSVQAHEDEAKGVYESSEQVVSALKNEWVAQSQAAAMVKIHQGRVDALTLSLENQRSAYDGIKTKIDELKSKFDELISKAKAALQAMQAALEMKDAKREAALGEESSSSGSALLSSSYDPKNTQEYEDSRSAYMADVFKLQGETNMSKGYDVDSWKVNGTPKVDRPVSDNNAQPGVSIANVIIQGVTGSASDFADAFVREIQRETRTL